MTRYWVIAPYANEEKIFDAVWKFDLENSVISIGWRGLGDFSTLDKEQLKNLYISTTNEKNPGKITNTVNMLWNFNNSVDVGDIIIARRGRKEIAAIGTVVKTAYYSEKRNESEFTNLKDDYHSHYIDVGWHDEPRNLKFTKIVFGMQTIYDIDEDKYYEIIGGEDFELNQDFYNQTEFALEKYLEDFIVSNFEKIFGNALILYKDATEGLIGQQYVTEIGNIDILAQEPISKTFVVIELKKGLESDRVVGQTLRYMGWVEENLCENDQDVKGIIICQESDPKLTYALKPVDSISLKHYKIDFTLVDPQ